MLYSYAFSRSLKTDKQLALGTHKLATELELQLVYAASKNILQTVDIVV